MQRILFISLFIISYTSSFAQLGNSTSGSTSVTDVIDPSYQNTGLRYAERFKEVEGSPYLFDTWKSGELVTSVGKKVEGLTLKFDAYSNILVLQKEEEEVALMDGAISEFSLFDLEGKQMLFRKFPLGKMGKQVFAQILFYGKLILVKHHKVSRVRKENNSGGYGDAGNMKETEHFSHTNVYYIKQKESDTFEPFKPNRKAMLKMLPDHQDEITSYMKKEKLKLKDDDEIIQLLQYYESL